VIGTSAQRAESALGVPTSAETPAALTFRSRPSSPRLAV